MRRPFASPFIVAALTALAGCGSVQEFPDAGGGADGASLDAGDPDAATDAGTDGAGLATLTVVRGGAATGMVVSSPAGVACGATCSYAFPVGTLVTLTATADAGATFAGWGGACAGTIGTCSFTINGDTAVNAGFAPAMHTVTLAVGGNGTGTVTSNTGGLACPGTCTTTVPYGTSLTLTPTAQGASIFLGWSGGACSGTSACTFTVTGNTTINASFALNYTLVVTRTGNGNGGITSSPVGINCGADCDETYGAGTVVTLTATPGVDSTFAGWTGSGCSGTGTCAVTINGATAVTATFTLRRYTLSAATAGTGGGVITSNPTGITCPGDCSEALNHGTMVTLTATPNGQSTFTGWTGDCTGSGACTVTMDQARNVTATFTLQSYGVTVIPAGNGTGTVTSAPAGITCGADCTESYAAGTMVTLTAAPAATSTFTGWTGGGCSGSGTCTVTVASAVSVTATFTLKQYTLTVATAGSGTGTVASSPAAINCPGTCAATFNHGQIIVLTASASAPSSQFAGWTGGGCSGTGTCTVTLTAATSVSATFNPMPYTLTVTKAGSGQGTVTSAPAGISCGATCAAPFNYNTSVTLTAAPANAPLSAVSTFAGWSGGGCSGTGACTVMMSAATAVTATFTLTPNIAFVTSTTYTGNVGGLAGADAACQARAQVGGLAGTYRAWLSTASSSALSRLGSASGWVRPDGLPFVNSQADLTGGKILYTLTVDELGNASNGRNVRTATTPAGQPGAQNCTDWTDGTSTTSLVTFGTNSNGTFSWDSNGSTSCSATLPVYCFGVDRAAAVTVPVPANVRRAFTSESGFVPGGGLAAADAQCQADATAAGLPGSYRALLASYTAAAGISSASRFTTTGAPWARVDNVLLAPTAAALFSVNTAYWDAAFNVSASGAYRTGNMWAGATTVNAGGSAASTCTNWTTNLATSFGWAGIRQASTVSVAFGNYATQSSLTECDSTHALYCLQQ